MHTSVDTLGTSARHLVTAWMFLEPNIIHILNAQTPASQKRITCLKKFFFGTPCIFIDFVRYQENFFFFIYKMKLYLSSLNPFATKILPIYSVFNNDCPKSSDL